MIQILLVDNQPERCDALRQLAKQHRIEMSVLREPRHVEHRFESGEQPGVQAPALVIMRHDLPHVDGIAALRRIRDSGHDVPVLITSPSNDIADMVMAFELGANDYIAEPHDPREVVARVKNALRLRTSAEPAANRSEIEQIAFDDILVDVKRWGVSRRGARMPMRPTQFALLMVLASHPLQVLSRFDIIELLKPRCSMTERGLNVAIFRLRAALQQTPRGGDYIRTVRSEGYMFTPDTDVLTHFDA